MPRTIGSIRLESNVIIANIYKVDDDGGSVRVNRDEKNIFIKREN